MKKTVKPKATKPKEVPKQEAARRRADDMMRPARCRSYMRRELAQAFPGIVEGFVKAAKTGSVPHVKLATELLKPTRKGTARRKGPAARLLEKLERESAARRRSGAGGAAEEPPQG
jgi:hypothetical protein